MYIAIEWTSLAFKAMLIDGDEVLGTRNSDLGTTKIVGGTYEKVLRQEIGDWLPLASKILLSGMITSRNGWIESPFALVPAGPADLAAQAITHVVDGLPPLMFLPGIAQSEPLPDVMRGEEMALFGLQEADGMFVLPGPHAKWVRKDGGRVASITTYMSGEIANLLKRDSLVSRLIPPVSEARPVAFRRGVETAFDQGTFSGGILGRIFSARSLVLFDRLEPDDISDYISGLLVGAEVQEAIGAQRGDTIGVLGHGDVAERYLIALELLGVEARLLVPDAVAGFRKVAGAI